MAHDDAANPATAEVAKEVALLLDLEETPRGAVFTVVGLLKAGPNIRYEAPCTQGYSE